MILYKVTQAQFELCIYCYLRNELLSLDLLHQFFFFHSQFDSKKEEIYFYLEQSVLSLYDLKE